MSLVIGTTSFLYEKKIKLILKTTERSIFLSDWYFDICSTLYAIALFIHFSRTPYRYPSRIVNEILVLGVV